MTEHTEHDPRRNLPEAPAVKNGGLGPGDASVILGADPEKSAYTLWAEKSGLLDPEPPDERQRLNRDLEEHMARRFREVTGQRTRRVRRWYRSPAHPYAYARLEHLVLKQGAGLTCAVLTGEDAHQARRGDYPRRYHYACLHQMLVTGRNRWYLATLTPGKGFGVFQLTGTPEELRALAQVEEQFWQRVERREPPMADGSPSTLRTLERLYPMTGGKSVDLSPVALQVHDYIRWRHLEQQAAATARLQAGIIKAHLAGSGRGHLGDIRVQWMPIDTPETAPGALGSGQQTGDGTTTTGRIFRVISPEYGLLEESTDPRPGGYTPGK